MTFNDAMPRTQSAEEVRGESSASVDMRQQVQAAAQAIMEKTRLALLTTLPFMGPALFVMPFSMMPLGRGCVATDGQRIGYDALKTARTFRDDPNELLRAYLHLVLHCVYRHPFDSRHPRRAWWDVACDVAVGATALELVGRRFPCKDDEARVDALTQLKSYCPVVTAPKVYRAIAAAQGTGKQATDGYASDGRTDEHAPDAMPPELVERLAQLFACDDHNHWPRGIPRQDDERSKHRTSAADFEGIDPEAGLSESDLDADLWVKIAKRLEAEIDAYRNRPDLETGTFTVNLSMANRKRFDYRQFLKRFASLSEEVRTNPEEFDYIYYTHGLTLYENMPMVEPLEYQETSRVREFVIAIDTSASCSGDTVRRFVEQTYNILKSAGGFGADVNVHVIQCDDEIRKVLKVESIEDLEAYFSSFKMSGLGNTDFRPVFEYVDNAIATREFRNLKGIVYLTDGEGEYPSNRPSYDAVFVFVEPNPTYITYVPPWAFKAVMTEDQIIEL